MTPLNASRFSAPTVELAETLAGDDDLLLIQDLDGVCMGLVRDPLTRHLERRYLEASLALDGHFYVLTNGEHIGRRGVNRLVDTAVGGADAARAGHLYLPGLGGGGVQFQDACGTVTHPGIRREELAFLGDVPARLHARLLDFLALSPPGLPRTDARRLAQVCVLDNAVSPTLNLNPLYHAFENRIGIYRHVQDAAARFLAAELATAAEAGLGDAFFVHYAPNRGRDERGIEIMKTASDGDAGTTDFQFMLRGAVKEAGVLVLLNQYFGRHHGDYPLGPDFSVRDVSPDAHALIDIAAEHFPASAMPRIVGVGDTVSSIPVRQTAARGGSDRGFLQLVQDLGRRFDTDNLTLFVDSSGGEVRRPGLQGELHTPRGETRWEAMIGISDRDDPLHLNYVFRGGHGEYVDFFCDLASRRAARRRD